MPTITAETTPVGYLAARVRAYRLATAAARDIRLTLIRRGHGVPNQARGLHDATCEAAEAFADLYVRVEALAVLVAAEHSYLADPIRTRGSSRAHDDPGRLRYRRAVTTALAAATAREAGPPSTSSPTPRRHCPCPSSP